jgi:hypothetical protein
MNNIKIKIENFNLKHNSNIEFIQIILTSIANTKTEKMAIVQEARKHIKHGPKNNP